MDNTNTMDTTTTTNTNTTNTSITMLTNDNHNNDNNDTDQFTIKIVHYVNFYKASKCYNRIVYKTDNQIPILVFFFRESIHKRIYLRKQLQQNDKIHTRGINDNLLSTIRNTNSMRRFSSHKETLRDEYFSNFIKSIIVDLLNELKVSDEYKPIHYYNDNQLKEETIYIIENKVDEIESNKIHEYIMYKYEIEIKEIDVEKREKRNISYF